MSFAHRLFRSSRLRPRLESLEDRSVPSCTVSLFSPDTGQIGLLVQGDQKPDDIVIRGFRPNPTGDGTRIAVECDGKTQTFDSASQVVVRSGGGDDKISFPGFQGGVRVDVDSGAGNDTVTIWGTPDVAIGTFADIRIDTGKGDDAVPIQCGRRRRSALSRCCIDSDRTA